jgi:aminobenzoyl-glutamate transport protein
MDEQTRSTGHVATPPGQSDGASTRPPKSRLQRTFDVIERMGNKVPHPAVIFIWLSAVLIVLSHVLYLQGFGATYETVNPETHLPEQVTTQARSLLTGEGIRFIYSNVVDHFMGFNAIGLVITVMLGVGVAEYSGLIKALVRKLVAVSSPRALTYVLVLVGILSSIASDAGYLVLIPAGAAAFLSVGRNPLAGLAASFAAVAGVFSVNLVVKPIDVVLAELTNDAIRLVNPSVSISLTANFWFSVASVVVLTILCGLISEKIVEPRLGPYEPPAALREKLADEEGAEVAPADQSRGLRYANWALVAVLAVFAVLAIPPGAPLRNPETGALIGDSPYMSGLITFVALVFLVTGCAYGAGARTLEGMTAVVKAMERAVTSLGPLLVLLFFVAQFIALVTYSNIATIASAKLGDALATAGLGPIPLLVGFVVVGSLLNLVFAGIIPKWAILAPMFVPLLMRLNVQPEAVLAAYRVSDSPINVISPVMPYFPLIVSFAARYQPKAGIGTVIAIMIPYVAIIQVVWIVLLLAWQALGLPWGF